MFATTLKNVIRHRVGYNLTEETIDLEDRETLRSINKLPKDIIPKIMQNLDRESLQLFGRTNHGYRVLAKSCHRQRIRNHYKQAIDTLDITIDDIVKNFECLDCQSV